MSSTQRMASARGDAGEARLSLARRHPVTVFVVLVLAISSAVMAFPAALDLPVEPFILVVTFPVMLGTTLILTRLTGGPGAVGRLLSRTLIWRFGVVRWLVILGAMPVLTYGVAAATGTMSTPESSWLLLAGLYAFDTLIYGALILNIWEETSWGGFVQSRLMARRGLLVGSLVTAPLFAAGHIPFYLAQGATGSELAVGLVTVFALAPFYRYLLGMHLLDTRGSLLAIGVQHASWNACVGLDGVNGDWQVMVAVVLLTLLLAVGRRLRPAPAQPMGREAETAAAASWLTPAVGQGQRTT